MGASMKPGPGKTPSVVAQLRGNPGHRPINHNEPKPDRALPKPPKELSRRAKREWRRLAPALYKIGLLAEVYRDPLAAYCAALARWLEAEEMLNTPTDNRQRRNTVTTSGLVAVTPNGLVVKSAWLTISDKAFDQMLKAGKEFGMTPSAMASLSIEKPDDDDDVDEWESMGGARA